MTRPDQLKPREDSVPGTPYDGFEVGAALPELRFAITPAIVEEYFASVEADRSLYRLDGRQAAPPNVLFPYMTVPLYRKYPPIQGIVMAEVEFHWHNPIWADETADMVATGKVTEKFEKRGRRYVRWQADWKRADGTLMATMVNTFHVPS
ncbi:MAG: hypothetical protein AB7F36_02690 [Reyranellaceae bacterium]